jgi:hypothetical protein
MVISVNSSVKSAPGKYVEWQRGACTSRINLNPLKGDGKNDSTAYQGYRDS